MDVHFLDVRFLDVLFLDVCFLDLFRFLDVRFLDLFRLPRPDVLENLGWFLAPSGSYEELKSDDTTGVAPDDGT